MNKFIGIPLYLTILSANAASNTPDHMFPNDLHDGLVKHTFFLNEQLAEDKMRVELVMKTKVSPTCNKVKLKGEFTRKSLVGWGYSYFTAESSNEIASTMMACPEGIKRNILFAEHVHPELIRYNSKIPLVVYAPPGVKVGYNVWELTHSR